MSFCGEMLSKPFFLTLTNVSHSLLLNETFDSREMRLVGTGPKKFTRPSLHLKNIVKLLYKLSIDYIQLYKKYGLFLCQQSRSVLRTLHTLCSFVAKAASRFFSDSIVFDNENGHQKLAEGDLAQPLTSMLKQIDSFALEKLNQFVDGKIRAVTFLEIIDGILRVPIPTPRSLAHTNELPCASLRLNYDPDIHESENNRLEISPGSPVVCLALGTVPAPLIQRSKIPFNILLFWYILDSKGSSSKGPTSKKSQKHESGPIATSISSSGSFFVRIKSQALLNEGFYNLTFRLGCRDIRGGEWDLPLNKDPPCFSIKVLRSETK